jgi:hypothetical protein
MFKAIFGGFGHTFACRWPMTPKGVGLFFLHVLMIVAGLLFLGWGFWAAHNTKHPIDYIGSLAIPAGFVVALLGTLLVCVPGFFNY